MSRRNDKVYEERDFSYREERGPPVRTRERERDFEEVDIYSRRGPDRGSRPDFLREDFGRPESGPLVVRERDTEIISRPLERRPRSPSPVRIRERIIERSPTPPPAERIRTSTRIVERERQRSPSPPPPERLRARVVETRERIRERSPSPVRIRERIIERRSPSPPPPPQVERIRVRNIEREVRAPTPSPSPSPPPTPPPAPIRAPPIHQEIITHHRHIDHGFERARAPSPPPPPRRREPQQQTKETDIDIYTSRNNTEVDITKTFSRSRTPQPVVTRRDNFYDDSVLYDQERDKLRVKDTRLNITRRRSLSARPPPRERERVRVDIREDEEEADFYARKVADRAVIGEAFNGATKDWAIVDVPPGTERVRMDGVGGASEEITWQKYNGVRRSKFIPERERAPERAPERERERIEIREEPRRETTGLEIEISTGPRRREGGATYEREYERIEEVSDRRVGLPRGPQKQRVGDLWTEITKDLVNKEAIEQLGYDYEETEFFYYIIQYLRYEDVLELVQLTEVIRRERQDRIRDIQRERERFERRERDREEWERRDRRRERGGFEDERIIEREVIYDSSGRPRRGW